MAALRIRVYGEGEAAELGDGVLTAGHWPMGRIGGKWDRIQFRHTLSFSSNEVPPAPEAYVVGPNTTR